MKFQCQTESKFKTHFDACKVLNHTNSLCGMSLFITPCTWENELEDRFKDPTETRNKILYQPRITMESYHKKQNSQPTIEYSEDNNTIINTNSNNTDSNLNTNTITKPPGLQLQDDWFAYLTRALIKIEICKTLEECCILFMTNLDFNASEDEVRMWLGKQK